MQAADPSVAKSTTSTSTSTVAAGALTQGTSMAIDKVFPVFDQMMQRTRLPPWFLSTIAVFVLIQVLSVALWIYAPPFQRTTEPWSKIYTIALKVFTFQNPLEFTTPHLMQMYICLGVAIASLGWVLFTIFYFYKFLKLPTLMLYITTFVVDLICPVFITPATYVVCHGITGVSKEVNTAFVSEIIVGAIAYTLYIIFFWYGTLLKSRSVVLTNLTFPLFDSYPIILWVCVTSFFCIFSAILIFFDTWWYVVIGVVHVIATSYVCYRITFIPFYEVWRNAICLAFGFTTIALDFNFFILYIASSLTYNYTVFIFVACMLIFYSSNVIYYNIKVKKIKNQLTYNEEATDVQEYFTKLRVCQNPLRCMMYIVVGLARLCDYFIDGSLIDYVITNEVNASILYIILQVVTFFPSESRKMNILFKKLVMKSKLSYVDRFLVYQVYHIKTRRLVSDTKDTLEITNKLKALNEDAKASIHSFWDKQTCDNSYLTDLSQKIKWVHLNFQQAMGDNPNNARIAKEYSNFLSECLCDFPGAIVQSIRADYILDGRNFNVDVSFRSVVNKFPGYLKENIVDCKGRRVLQRKTSVDHGNVSVTATNSNSGSGSHGSTAGGSSLSIDMEQQEIAGKRLIRDSKVRLAFNHSIYGTRPSQSRYIIICGIQCFVIQLFFFIGFYAWSRKSMTWRRTSWQDIYSMGAARFYTNIAIFYIWSKWAADHHKLIDNQTVVATKLGNLTIDKVLPAPIIAHDMLYRNKIIYAVDHARQDLRSVLNSVAELAKGTNPYELASALLRSESVTKACDNDGVPILDIPTSLKDQYAYIFFMIRQLTGQIADGTVPDNLYRTAEYCQILSNTFKTADNSDSTYEALVNYNVKTASKHQKEFKLWMIIGIVCIFISSTIPELMIIKAYNNLINRTLTVLLALPNNIKEDAKKPVIINELSEDEDHNIHRNLKSHIMDAVALIYFFFVGCVMVSYVVLCYEVMHHNDHLTDVFKWFYYSIMRITSAIETGNDILQFILLYGWNQEIVSMDTLASRAKTDLQDLIKFHNILIEGGNGVKKMMGFNEEIDRLHTVESCTLPYDPRTVHDMYACASVQAQIVIFKQMVDSFLKDPAATNGTITDEVSLNTLHLLEDHFYPGVLVITRKLTGFLTSEYDSGIVIISVLLIVGIFFSFCGYMMSFAFRALVNDNYTVLLMLFQHIHPQTIIDTPEIMAFFKRHQKTSGPESMSISKSIIHDASEGIVITNATGVIEIINQSVTDDIGLTPDQMLGQEFNNFVTDSEQAKMAQQLQLMISGQGSSVWTDHVSMMKDTGEIVPFTVTMIAMKDTEESNINSFVYILTNETEEIRKRKAAEEAKAKSEKLLFQILPKDIVIRLNRGEKDISFTIPAATIFFVDIVKFSEYASLLTPTEIMSNLSLVFATFDKIVADYDEITKIKLIGDVYMAAAGLFQDPDNPTNKHAEQAVKCCLLISKSMEEINMKLNASLEVRIGVNSGGPLIGGVLGTDKPTFDIIGDPINVAARLQSTDVAGNVQISAETRSLILECGDFDIEERGEVYLKGKGNQVTYFVSNSKNKNGFEGSFAINISNV